MSRKKLDAITQHWHQAPRRSWARRQHKVDELPIEPTAWTPGHVSVQLPVRVTPSVAISLIPGDLEDSGRPLRRGLPAGAVDPHGRILESLPWIVCLAFAFLFAASLVLLYLDSPFSTRRSHTTVKGVGGDPSLGHNASFAQLSHPEDLGGKHTSTADIDTNSTMEEAHAGSDSGTSSSVTVKTRAAVTEER
ncbi:uncharacterized protein LOC144123311 [Amblyomma americanum]